MNTETDQPDRWQTAAGVGQVIAAIAAGGALAMVALALACWLIF